jgi:putative membrane protein
MHYGYGYHPSMGFGIFGGLLWLVVVVAIVVLVVSALRHRRGHGAWRHWSGGTALDILKERYAKGEIDKKEFEEKKKDLSD